MKRGRKPQSLFDRVQKHLREPASIAQELADYPAKRETPCWHWEGTTSQGGTPLIWTGSKVAPVVRAIIECACAEPLHETWRLKIELCGNQRCVNPRHWSLTPHALNRFSQPFPLPLKLQTLAPDQTAEQEMAELIEIILQHDPRPTPDEFIAICARANIEYPADQVTKAYALIAAGV